LGLPERHDTRVGDDERNAAVEELRVHFAAGRLTMDEFEERTGSALAARTVGDLTLLTADLPAVRTRSSGPPIRPRPPRSSDVWDILWRIHLGVWGLLVVFFVFVWAATGAGYFWPIWPALGIGLSVGVHGSVRKAVRG
jgi:hypothetical protein